MWLTIQLPNIELVSPSYKKREKYKDNITDLRHILEIWKI